MSSALEALGRHKEAYEAWVSASSACDPSPALSKQLEEAKERWLKKVRDVDVENSADFLNRYAILPDPRERLSTLAHFWNESSTQERLSIVVRFGNMISGPSGPPSRLSELTTENMASLPMENYFDLPITRITKWVAFYRGLDEESKAALCEGMWMKLSPHEQNAVVNDLSMFIIQ